MNRLLAIDSILSAWTGHKDFAIWLVSRLQPTTIVDLGVDYGFSTFCFAYPNIGTVYAVDWFQGDMHTGTRDTYSIVQDFKDVNGFDNVVIIKSNFDDLALSWTKNIDILHIDGLHTYEAVSHDFATWSEFITDNTVVLFHDTVAFSSTVGQFFNELPYPKFNFTHSAGLGVMCKNKELLAELYQYSLNCLDHKPNEVFYGQ